MKVSTNVVGWLTWLSFGWLAFRLWRSGLRPHPNRPRGMVRRTIYIVFAVFFTMMAIYFVGYGLGFYDIPQHWGVAVTAGGGSLGCRLGASGKRGTCKPRLVPSELFE